MAEFEQFDREDQISEVDELRCQLQRLQADFVNYKQRVERERARQIELANENIILKILPVELWTRS